MSTYAPNYIEAIEHLPEGAMLQLDGVSWDDYERLLDELAEWPGVRVSYDHGRLEIMSPTFEHEQYKSFISWTARILSEEMDLPVEAAGATTYKHEPFQGSEPDESFYVKNANAIIGKRRIDLSVDPPPDIVVEVDITNEPLSKFPIYAAFGVPEIWRYDGKQAQISHLVDQSYVRSEVSLAFPPLSPRSAYGFEPHWKPEQR
jgi:Uma2 family endonuclease